MDAIAYQDRVLQLYLQSLLKRDGRENTPTYPRAQLPRMTDRGPDTGQGLPGGDGLYPGFFPGPDAIPGA